MTEDEKLKIEAACIRLQTRYGTLADRQDPKFADLFIKDATITLPEYPPFAGLDAIMQGQADWKASGVVMRHIVTNCTIEVKSASHATGICYLTVLAHDRPLPPGTPLPAPRVTFGEFHDHFVKVGGAWLIQSRRLHRMFRGFGPA
ncbi:MAG: nuclear transport factor 2 family protein [Rhizomicrobium sp.]